MVTTPPPVLYGEILPSAVRPAEAVREFTTTLTRHSNRARLLFSTVSARTRVTLVEAYAAFLRAQTHRDAHLPDFK